MNRIVLFFMMTLSSLTLCTFEGTFDQLNDYELKDIGIMIATCHDQHLKELSDEELVTLGQRYLIMRKKIQEYNQQHLKDYSELIDNSNAIINDCTSLWFAYRRKACLKDAQNRTTNIITPKTDQSQKDRALATYTEVIRQQENSASIF